MRLVIASMPPIELHPLDADSLRAGAGGEVPNIAVRLDNARGELTSLLADPPLRAPATLYDLDGTVIITGAVHAVTLAAEAVIDIEA